MSRVQLPLDGIRVLEVSTALGAYCGRLLADAGADVVKLELPDGDELRLRPPFAGDRPGPGRSLSFAYYHANKRSAVLDYRAEASVPQLARLAATCDVIIATPTTRHPIAGFDPATRSLSWAPTDAVVCFLTPFGLTGPYRSWRATHLTLYAMSGLMYEQGPVEGPPVVIPGQQYYDHASTHAAIAILAALRERERVGGQTIDLSVHESTANSYYSLYRYTSAADIARRRPAAEGASTGIWNCADGRVQIVLSTDKHWLGLVKLLGNPPAIADPSWAHPAVRALHERLIVETIAPLIAKINREDFVARAQGLGVPCAPINSIGDFVNDPQPRTRGFFIRQPDAEIGEFETPGAPFRTTYPMLRTERRAAPVLGQHQVADILASWAMPTTPSPPHAPLSSIRVLCLGTAIAGALTGTMLADLGADVVKMEAPYRPDNMRRLSEPAHKVVVEPPGATTSPMFASNNRSMRSLALDMRQPGAVELFLRLVEVCDVIVENYGPGVMRRWGVPYERLAEVNPRIVMVSLTGFGHLPGPRTHYLAYGSTVASFTGLTEAWGYPSSTHFDYISQAHGVFGVLVALAARDRTGRGTHVDLAEVEAGAAVMGPLLLDYTVNGRDSRPYGNQVPGAALAEVVRCLGEDRWLAVEAEDADDLAQLAAVLGRSDLASNIGKLSEALRDWAAQRTPHQAMRQLQEANLAAGVVQTNEDVTLDPQHRARAAFVELDHPDLGVIEFAAPVHRLSKTPALVRRRTPRLGEHNMEILTEWLGFSDEEAARWSWPASGEAAS